MPKPLWILLLLATTCALVIKWFIPAKSFFVFDSEPAFFAVVGFAIPFLLVVISRITGAILRRDLDYWKRPINMKEEKE